MFPRLHRYEVCLLISAERFPLPAWLQVGVCCGTLGLLGSLFLGCSRCGTCDEGFYNLWGECHECGPASLVFFLSRALPALAVFAGTSILLWGGTLLRR